MSLSVCWKKAVWSIVLLLAFLTVMFFDTWAAMVRTWLGSATFTHGFLVAPISLWLIWDRWPRYRNLAPRFDWWPVALVLLSGAIWLVGSLANVLIVQEYALVAMLVAGIWAILGHDVARRMMFPLGFLFFMVPVGKALVPPMMEFTATFTVDMLQLTGIPVYREGMFFTLPSGSWSVVEACSGVRYLIASVTLGFLYAYLTYTKFWKRVLFILLSFIVPVIANGLRAYGIVMLGHLSDMKLAVGVDHLIYGWIFFGIVMAILFYIGSFWKDPVEDEEAAPVATKAPNAEACRRNHVLPFALTLALASGAWPVAASWMRAQTLAEGPSLTELSGRISGAWRGAGDPRWGWAPSIDGAVSDSTSYYREADRIVGLYLASFGNEVQGRELVSGEHRLLNPKDRRWREVSRRGHRVTLVDGHAITVDEVALRSFDRDLLVYLWYQIGDENTANPYLAKALQVEKRLLGDTESELQVVLFTTARPGHHDEARAVLDRFARDWVKQRDGADGK